MKAVQTSLTEFLRTLSLKEQEAVLNSFGQSVDPYTKSAFNAAGRALTESSGAYNLTVGQVESIYRDILNYSGASGSGQLDAMARAAGAAVQNQINNAIKKAAGIPGFAEGGVTPVNQPFIVGENGPEIMMSGRSHTVYPSIQMGDPELKAEFAAYRRQSAQETMLLKNTIETMAESISRLTRSLDRVASSRGA